MGTEFGPVMSSEKKRCKALGTGGEDGEKVVFKRQLSLLTVVEAIIAWKN